MSHLSASKASKIHSHAGLAAGPLAPLAFRPWFRQQRRSPLQRSRSLFPHFWASGSGGGLSPGSPAGSCVAGRLHGPGVSPQLLLLLPAPSSALQPPSASCLSLLGGSPARGRSGLPLPPLNPCARWGGSVALSSPVAGCPSRPRGWGTPSGSPPTPGSSSPCAVVGVAPSTAAWVPDASPGPRRLAGSPLRVWAALLCFPRLRRRSQSVGSR